MTVWIYFKLFNNIKFKHEAMDFAEMELERLFGSVKAVPNFAEEISKSPLNNFKSIVFEGAEAPRVVDALMHELPYGSRHGYKTRIPDSRRLSSLVRRLAYTREIYVITKARDPKKTVEFWCPEAQLNKNVQIATSKGYVMARFITNQYFLENSEYISRLSRNEMEVDANVERMFKFLTQRLYRIPASTTMRIGKRLEDYFAIREENSLYLVHYMHPYKGKFHPKMARALINYVMPENKGLIMDNYAGSGTLLAEATLLGLDSIGVDVNPLSSLMSNVKCDALRVIDPRELKTQIANYIEKLNSWSNALEHGGPPLDQFDNETYSSITKGIHQEASVLLSELDQWSKNHNRIEEQMDILLLAKRLIGVEVKGEEYRSFFLLALSGSISDMIRRRKGEFVEVFHKRLLNLYLRIYLFNRMNEVLCIDVGTGLCHTGDTRDLTPLKLPLVNGNVNSPPYSTALDYIKNDQPQLSILKLHPDIDKLAASMVGFPGVNYDRKTLLKEISEREPPFTDLPEMARDVVDRLIELDRSDAALRTYKFFVDTMQTMKEVHNCLNSDAKYVIIIGNNWYKVKGETNSSGDWSDDSNGLSSDLQTEELDYRNIPVESDGFFCVKNDEVTIAIGEQIGFEVDRTVTRMIEKSSVGRIRYESVVVLKK